MTGTSAPGAATTTSWAAPGLGLGDDEAEVPAGVEAEGAAHIACAGRSSAASNQCASRISSA